MEWVIGGEAPPNKDILVDNNHHSLNDEDDCKNDDSVLHLQTRISWETMMMMMIVVRMMMVMMMFTTKQGNPDPGSHFSWHGIETCS